MQPLRWCVPLALACAPQALGLQHRRRTCGPLGSGRHQFNPWFQPKQHWKQNSIITSLICSVSFCWKGGCGQLQWGVSPGPSPSVCVSHSVGPWVSHSWWRELSSLALIANEAGEAQGVVTKSRPITKLEENVQPRRRLEYNKRLFHSETFLRKETGITFCTSMRGMDEWIHDEFHEFS